tara:strand:- start:181 stop:1221 length:1041 start_codon:yes stop_codon:yes gene_type:complete
VFLAINAAFILLINNKGVNMNNLKKVGLSALAGSLVAFSANAVDMSVTGTAEVTYTTVGGSTANTGNPFGANNSVKFSGSGDVGVGTATITRTINDSIGSEWLSAWMTLDMGSMGKLSLDSVGGDLEGVGPKDDNLPTAYEEVWTGVSSSGIAGAASNDTIGYSNSFAGVTLSLARSSQGTANTGDGGSDGPGVTQTVSDYHVTAAVPYVEGLTVQYGRSTIDFAAAGENDDVYHVGHLLYSTGPVSVGYRYGTFEDGSNGSNAHEMEAYAVAFNVNDEMSVSFATQDKTYDVASGTDVTETSDAINASYTMGAMTFRGTIGEADNAGGITSTTDEHMELSMLLAF